MKRKRLFIAVVIIIVFGVIYSCAHGKVNGSMLYEYWVRMVSQIGMPLLATISACLCAVLGIVMCILGAKRIDRTKHDVAYLNLSFQERHPRLNTLIALLVLVIFGSIIYGVFYYTVRTLGMGISRLVQWMTGVASKLDAVIIVALITGTVSIVGVIISSIVSKIIDYKKSRQEYLAMKREVPYGEFVEMVYKIRENGIKKNTYTEQMMLDDLSKFSKQITLWGSSKVVKKWVEFRNSTSKIDDGTGKLFLMEDIMNEMRRDLGLKRVKKGELLAFFVNNIKAVKRVKK